VVTINDCVYSFGEPTAPWGGIRHSGIGRTHGLAGLREMVSVKYVASDFTRRPNIWWYPYGASLTRFLNTANRALYGRSVFSRVRHQLGLMAFPRFWRRANLPSILANIDKLF
jgi:succinate-semialdehyde dehydrogenase/glutarate-semialdehyde dehydrogenase